MQLTLLGTGTPNPNPKRRGPACLIHAGAEKIQVDCGSGAIHQLIQSGVSPVDINHLLITHLHSDHYIDLGHFLITRWIYGDDKPLHLYGPQGLQVMIDRLLEMHAFDLEMRVKASARPLEMPQVIIHEIEEGVVLENENLKLIGFRVDHFPIEQAFGFRFDMQKKRVVISGDTVPCENLVRHAHRAELLVHNCVENSKVKGLIHVSNTSPEELGLVAKDAKVGMLVTTHMLKDTVPREMREIISKDFEGQVVIGEDLMTI